MKKRLWVLLLLAAMLLTSACAAKHEQKVDRDLEDATQKAKDFVQYAYNTHRTSFPGIGSYYYPDALYEADSSADEVQEIYENLFNTVTNKGADLNRTDYYELSDSEIRSYISEMGYSFDIEKAYNIQITIGDDDDVFVYPIHNLVAKIDGNWYIMPRLDGDRLVVGGNTAAENAAIEDD